MRSECFVEKLVRGGESVRGLDEEPLGLNDRHLETS
jgi:hypothetical protein